MNTAEIWQAYHTDVKRFIRSKVKNEHITDDLLQETFIKVHTKLESLKDVAKIKSWIMTITRNIVFDYFKKKEWLVNGEAIIVEPDDEVDDKHTEQDCLHGIIKRLPKKYMDPLFLADIKGVKQAEIADRLNLGLPTTKSRIHRARKLIAQGYMECCDYKINHKGVLVGEIKEKEDCKVCS